jgi:general secretion pathway protein H
MRTSAPGIRLAPTLATACAALPPEGVKSAWGGPALILTPTRQRGFTLLELLVVVAIMALATAGVGFALRDSTAGDLERDAQRLAALLESARAQSRMSGNPVRWHSTSTGFAFEGLPGSTLPDRWLYVDTRTAHTGMVNLGPEPIIGAQSILVSSTSHPDRSLTVITDGVRPFSVVAVLPETQTLR